jgi:hypothetical protein
MPIEFRTGEVRLAETCGAEEALELSDWLLSADLPKVDLGDCTNLHPALLQTLLAHKPAISVEPKDPFLSRWILPMLAPGRDEE